MTRWVSTKGSPKLLVLAIHSGTTQCSPTTPLQSPLVSTAPVCDLEWALSLGGLDRHMAHLCKHKHSCSPGETLPDARPDRALRNAGWSPLHQPPSPGTCVTCSRVANSSLITPVPSWRPPPEHLPHRPRQIVPFVPHVSTIFWITITKMTALNRNGILLFCFLLTRTQTSQGQGPWNLQPSLVWY